MNHKSRIGAVIVTYHPDLDVLDRLIEAIEPQVAAVFVADNGSRAEVLEWLEGQKNDWKISICALGENKGVAVGHNIGIEWAKGQGFSHVLLLDQDSIPAPDMVNLLLDVATKASDRGEKVCAVGPHYFDPVTGYASFFIRFGRLRLQRIHCYTQVGQQPVPVDFLISSGALIPMEALRIVGNMDEGLFVDHVDTEWFLRARSKGFNAYGVCQAQMRHSLGNDTVKIWLGRWYHVPIHSPLRHYYVFRNSAVLYQRNYVPLQWILNDAVRLVSMFVFYSLVTPPRFQHFIMMLKGFWDGLHGRHGRYVAERKSREEAT